MKKGIALVFAVLVGLMWFSCAWAKGDQVVIKRDSYGVSHVYAESVDGHVKLSQKWSFGIEPLGE